VRVIGVEAGRALSFASCSAAGRRSTSARRRTRRRGALGTIARGAARQGDLGRCWNGPAGIAEAGTPFIKLMQTLVNLSPPSQELDSAAAIIADALQMVQDDVRPMREAELVEQLRWGVGPRGRARASTPTATGHRETARIAGRLAGEGRVRVVKTMQSFHRCRAVTTGRSRPDGRPQGRSGAAAATRVARAVRRPHRPASGQRVRTVDREAVKASSAVMSCASVSFRQVRPVRRLAWPDLGRGRPGCARGVAVQGEAGGVDTAAVNSAISAPQALPDKAFGAVPEAAGVADVILAAMALHRATCCWFEPVVGGTHRDAHKISLERGATPVASAVLGGGLGDAVIARLALLCELDLLERAPQTGRTRVQCGDRELEVLVTTRSTAHGLAGELRVLGEAASGPGQARPGEGGELPELLPEGTEIASYRIIGTLGRGGMGVVYRVEHQVLRKEFALKVLAGAVLASDPDSARRFQREARAAARVKHHGIVDVSDFGTLPDGRPYLVMELLRGESLAERLRRDGALQPAHAVRLVRKATEALAAAHRAGVVHRDITASNIFVERDASGDELVKLVDFGAARTPEPGEEIPDGPPGMVLGTPYYMAPEQARGQHTDERTDIYSLGVVLYEVLAGAVPFNDPSIREIVRKHVFEPAPLPRSPHEALPEDLERLVERCLAKEPAERYQSADALLDDLLTIERLFERKGWRKWIPV
jgi:serine/threonine-protein kinase